MKNVFKILLVIAIIGLIWATYKSVETPITFQRTREAREAAIIKELMDIRTAQVAYKQEHNVHAANFQELRNWLENGSVTTVRRELELTEEQLEKGMTEEKAVEIIKKAKATGKWAEAEKEGLVIEQNGKRVVFTRDTVLVNAKSEVLGADYNLSKLGVVPGTNVEFDMDTASVQTASGINIRIFQASVPYTAYLSDLSKSELDNLVDKQTQLDKFPGLKVGSLTEINNNAGNWE
ncbi:MAG: hypothetical protein Q4D93_06570 [Porphyromonas sp.]|nr:hypothetical protein [Porphyromonas sp.]